MKKVLLGVGLVVALIGVFFIGKTQGYNEGNKAGYENGYNAGYETCETESERIVFDNMTPCYNVTFDDGTRMGYAIGLRHIIVTRTENGDYNLDFEVHDVTMNIFNVYNNKVAGLYFDGDYASYEINPINF